MEMIQQVRDMYYRQGKNISEISDQLKLNWKTVQKYIDKTDFNVPLERAKDAEPSFKKLEPYKTMIDQWLNDDKKAPRKQRHTAKRIYI